MSSNIKRNGHVPLIAAEKSNGHHKASWGDQLTRNAAIATLLLLTVVGIQKSHGTPQDFLNTVQTAVQSEWDQNVGKLTYVNSEFMDAMQVFGYHSDSFNHLTSPTFAAAKPEKSDGAAYLLYDRPKSVFAVADGEVLQIVHDDNDAFILRIAHGDGLNSIYYGLDSCFVQEGDTVTANTVLGSSSGILALELQRNGKNITSDKLLSPREAAK